MTDDSSTVKILLMRHAESNANLLQYDFVKNNGYHPKFENVDYRWLNDASLVDAPLSPTGIDQCRVANDAISHRHAGIRHVFVSPLRRAVQTAVMAMQGYAGQLEWRVMPWFREIMLSQADLPLYTFELLRQHSFIDCAELKGDPLWFLDYYIERHENADFAVRARNAYNEKPEIQTLIDMIKNEFPNVETPKQMIARAEKVREVVREFLRQKKEAGTPVADGELMLVGHSRMLKFFHGVFSESGEIDASKDLNYINGEIKEYEMKY